MISFGAIVFCVSFGVVWCIDLTFPLDFKFGAATAAYQVEGGWNASDKSESIWDVFTHSNPQLISDQTNGDVACDSYNQWQRDIDIAADLGLDFYRFSISWPRLLPSGFPDKISKDGVRYYNNLIDGLLAKNIEPVVTLYHWDLPQSLQNLGGWTNPIIADWFADYARVAFSMFGDRVKTWVTINEPMSICDFGYGYGYLAPGVKSPDYGNFLCAKNVQMAHAKAWHVYDQEFRAKFTGKLGLTNHLLWMEANAEGDEELANLARQLSVGLYSHAIYSQEGGWPPALEGYVAEYSKKQGYSRSRMPPFTKKERELCRGAYDFYGFNHYTSRTVRELKDDGSTIWPITGSKLLNVRLEVRPDWKPTVSQWFFTNPEGIRHQLLWVKQQYGNVPILITENGYPSEGKQLEDKERISFLNDYMEQVLLSIKLDDVNVVGYTAWSLLDNFEWTSGYKSRFGICEVDFESPSRTVTPRLSAKFYASVIQNRSLNVTSKYINDELYLMFCSSHLKFIGDRLLAQ